MPSRSARASKGSASTLPQTATRRSQWVVNVLSLFAGIGGFDCGLERAGFTVAGQIEIDPFCERVLTRRWPSVPRYGDIRTVALASATGEQQLERPDILVGGFPCQGASVAGKRRGLADDRTALFWEIIRVQKVVKAPWALLENVPGLRSVGLGHDFPTVVAALAECWPAVGWRTLDSRFFNVAQRRERVFFVCGPTEAGVARVLALTEGSEGDSSAGQEEGADAPGSARTSPAIIGRYHKGPDSDATDAIVVTDTLNNGGYGIANAILTPNGGRGGIGVGAIAQRSAVRRLTPLECERLQGFPDGWTCLCQPLEAYAADPDTAALRCTCPDSPRYRALGNAVTVSVVEWIGRRLIECLRAV